VRIDAWGLQPGSLTPLAGDASSRRYLRGVDGRGRKIVVMDCGEPLPPVVDGRDGFSFTRWQSFYAGLGIRVPEIYAIERDAGLVLLEDLGDELLQFRVEAVGAEACEGFYLRAAEWSLRLAASSPPQDPSDDPLTPARLALEMDLFLVHAAGVPVTQPSLPPLRAAAAALDAVPEGALRRARELLHRLCEDVHAFAPMTPCHRDYHARNLMLVREHGREEVAVIDFQDTRPGPRAYDLASLAWDPYVTLPEPLVAKLVEAWRPEGVHAPDWDREVRLAAGQRLLKAAGSYAWLSRAQGKSQYAQWLAPALARAWERLEGWEMREEAWRALRGVSALE
jgi:aminoglycoside/choline kinase family phosphotransferase